MKINFAQIKRTLGLLGLDLDDIFAQAAPTINKQLDKTLEDISLEDGQSKGIVIVPNGNGEYYVVKTRFKRNANLYMEKLGYTKLSDLMTKLLTSLSNG